MPHKMKSKVVKKNNSNTNVSSTTTTTKTTTTGTATSSKTPIITNNNNNNNENNNNNDINDINEVQPNRTFGDNEQPKPVDGFRTSTSCDENRLTPDDLLPKYSDSNNSKAEGILKGSDLLRVDSGYHIGANTVGSSLRNANLQLRSEPPNPRQNVSPWLNSTIAPDLMRLPLEENESSYSNINTNENANENSNENSNKNA